MAQFVKETIQGKVKKWRLQKASRFSTRHLTRNLHPTPEI
jgi:hypothetical protein